MTTLRINVTHRRIKEVVLKETVGCEKRRRSPRLQPDLAKESTSNTSIVEKEPDISTLPPIIFEGKINYVSDFFGCAVVCDNIIQQVEKHNDDVIPIGFDLEWPFSFQTGSGKTALAQICLEKSICYLIHVYSLDKLPAAFVVLLSHPKVRLVGVNIKNDIWKLGRDFKGFPAEKIVQENCIDLGVFTNRVLNRSCRWSLARLTAYLLKGQISKDGAVRRSKWHIQPLTQAQQTYAATDAYVSLLLYLTIQEKVEEQEINTLNEESALTDNFDELDDK